MSSQPPEVSIVLPGCGSPCVSPGGPGPALRDQFVVAGDQPPERRRVLGDQERGRTRIGTAVRVVARPQAAAAQGRHHLVAVRDREIVRQGVPPGRGRSRVDGGDQVQHGPPVRGPGKLAPLEALPVDEWVQRDGEPVVGPGQRLAVAGGDRRQHEGRAAGPQVPGGGEGGAQPAERRVQRVARRVPLDLQVIGGDKPAGARGVGDFPVVAAEADSPVGQGGDRQFPAARQRRRENHRGEIFRWAQHILTVERPPAASFSSPTSRRPNYILESYSITLDGAGSPAG
jgi:hypothetical protein